MAETRSPSRFVRFAAFEADLRSGELRKDGVKLKISGQPFQVLAILLERPAWAAGLPLNGKVHAGPFYLAEPATPAKPLDRSCSG